MSEISTRADLIAVLVAVTAREPRVLTIEAGLALPSGSLESGHRSLQAGLRAWVERQTHHPLGYVEQLYTFADQTRGSSLDQDRRISISYLALTREIKPQDEDAASWRSWYDYFPWEDQRETIGNQALIDQIMLPRLGVWAGVLADRQLRVDVLFGRNGHRWNEELVLQRYELLYQAGLVPEARRDGIVIGAGPVPGLEMQHDHRRILATAIARLRAKIKYRPVVFELLPQDFTLLELQQAVEALAGQALHKPNFRRLIEQQELVEETGQFATGLARRPAKLFRFRPSVLEERAFAGSKLPLVRS
ncbi:MAG: hypothetical protein B7Z78_08410 [Rhodospirillales bacterium 20-60-12]|nr:MAG: hypothetical protein B7Z78_08410 [Rhodospirillales bacterium 20-60-12]HQT66660.1 hypothetical protein [Acetobacteraceae bacterium]HQU01836.1 hypothetical protein [Acetobacteraceae bacterium]